MSKARIKAHAFLSSFLADASILDISDPRLRLLRTGLYSTEELAGFFDAIMSLAVSISFNSPILDTCGTGGDGKRTFNVSTAAGLIAACCGMTVAKCGNRASTSTCGSADFLEALGISIDAEPNEAISMLHSLRFAFLFTQRYHPALRAIAPLRKQLSFPTIFNLLGPLCNPALPSYRLIGIASPEWMNIYRDLIIELGTKRTLIVYSDDGLDEVSLTATTNILEINDASCTIHRVNPTEVGIKLGSLHEVTGQDANINVTRFFNAIRGRDPAIRDFCIVNAGAALWATRLADSFQEGCSMAKASFMNGSLADFIDRLLKSKRPTLSEHCVNNDY